MAPRETYDPEDIESLLNERGFDELLAEERAFVLRHLNGREEYERMRELLMRVREEEAGAAGEVLLPDGSVREHVLRVFEQEHTTGWKHWLNSVKVFLVPQQASAMWRPALAIATVALLVTFGVVTYKRSIVGSAPQVAEARETSTTTERERPPAAQQRSDGNVEKVATELQQATNEHTRSSTDLTRPEDAWSPLAEVFEEPPAPVQEQMDVAADGTGTLDAVTVSGAGVASADKKAEAEEAPKVNYVEKDQLLSNQSMANAKGEVTMKEVVTASERERRKARSDQKMETALASRNLAQDDQLIELLNAAW